MRAPPRGTRPTSDRVREAVFSTLESRMDLDGVRVLDLYAGSGGMGLEALSRGAAHARFVESDRHVAATLRRNAEALGLPSAVVTVGTVAAVLASGPEHAYDLVLADPPYALGDDELAAALEALVKHGWLRTGTVLMIERSARDAAPRWPDGVAAVTERRYGDARVYYGHAS